MSNLNWDIGVCSWSLLNNIKLLAKLKKRADISTLHLHIRPELGPENTEFISAVQDQGWNISSGMVGFAQEDYSTLASIKQTGGIVPDECWPENKNKVCCAVDILSDLNVPYLSFHFGFLNVEDTKLVDRVKVLADYASSMKITLLMETGQETAEELKAFLQRINHPALSVNFDPANMILYDKGQPAKAIDSLKSWIKHVHIKDAKRAVKEGQWGEESPWSLGDVNCDEFLKKLESIDYCGALCVEREQGVNKLDDITLAIEKFKMFCSSYTLKGK